jgi:hypothetical protein
MITITQEQSYIDERTAMPGFIRVAYLTSVLLGLSLLHGVTVLANFDPIRFANNMDDSKYKPAYCGKIQGLQIIRGGAEFNLGPGEISLYDFGINKITAMHFKGKGNFRFIPPNDIERQQLIKFTNRDSINAEFESACFYFNIAPDFLPDTSMLAFEADDDGGRRNLWKTYKDAFEYCGIYLVNFLLPDIASGNDGYNFFADFKIKGIGRLAFIESPYRDDYYSLIRLQKKLHNRYDDVLCGWSSDNLLRMQRGVLAIDVSHYEIESTIEGDGKMTSSCRIHFNPLRWGVKVLYFTWYYGNDLISVTDSNGNPVKYIGQKDEDGFSVVLNNPLEMGKPDYLDMEFECGAVDELWGIFYVKEQAYWYPQYNLTDNAIYKLTFNCPKYFEVLASGNRIESGVEGGRRISKWVLNNPGYFVSFNIGKFETKEVSVKGLPVVESCIAENIPHKELALYLVATEGTLSSKDMIGNVAADVTNSLNFFTNILGPCPHDTIRATEIPYNMGQSSPGFILIAWSSFQKEALTGRSEVFRAHEVAHQWWGNMVGWANYRDYWIIEGMAEYSGFWFFQMSSNDKKKCDNLLKEYRRCIISGKDVDSDGSKAGPLILGHRLNSTKSSDYFPIVYYKGAYIFHMIRYILHDYKTGSDDVFAAFLKSLVDKFKGKVITTELLQKHLEEFTGEDVSWFFKEWVYGTEIPEYKFSYEYTEAEDGKYSVTCNVKEENVPADFQMQVPITVLFEDDMYIHLKLWIDQPEMTIDLPKLPYEPKKIIFNTYDAVLCKVEYE